MENEEKIRKKKKEKKEKEGFWRRIEDQKNSILARKKADPLIL